MKIIRRGCFETNSSSSHSVTISTRSYNIPVVDLKGGPYDIVGGEFGWEIDTHSDTVTKINYAAVEAKQTGNDYLEELLVELLRETYNCGEVNFNFNTNWEAGTTNAYIDHQSHGTLWDTLTCSGGDIKNNLRDFLFNPNSSVSTDNDNH